MSYTALYRKWRPVSFEDVKGQDPIVQTLKNQITSERIGHAYLFCGTRGTGKTSIAKLIQLIGDGTRQLGEAKAGDTVNVVLPLGNGFTMPEKASDKLLLVGGGVGTAPMLYLGEQLAKNGSKPTFLLGARSNKDLLQLEQFAAYGDVYTTTEDGSHGEKGYVTQHSILNKVQFEQIYTCGPKPMMMAVAKYAKSKDIACEVSLENTMACGIGACLCCVENTTEGHLCVCKEGPVFNINKLLWQI